MKDDVKKFFEELSQAEKEYTPELVKASTPVVAKEVEEEIADTIDEDEGQLTIDVYQTPNEIVIESTIAGVKPDDLDIAINSDSVTIKGKRHRETKVSDEDYFYQECYWGKFARSIILPQEIDAESASAGLKNGVLVIKLPKLTKQRSKKLRVKMD